MAKSRKFERRSDTNGVSLHKICGGAETSEVVKEWEDAVCSVCMEFPHNAVLLLCSSFDKGCRPFMCATSHRLSNCLHQYKKGCRTRDDGEESSCPLLCPLCRCPVKGWTAVEAARRYLNAKKRGCMQDKCSFVGNYRELRKHVKVEHPLACPRAVDPSHVAKWKRLENERDVSDVLSTIRSTMPGAIIIGDYVIERRNYYAEQHQGLFQRPPSLFVDQDEDFHGRISHQRASTRRAARLRAGR